MTKLLFFIHILFCFKLSYTQTKTQLLSNAFAVFEKDPQLRLATSSLYVIDAENDEVVFSKNADKLMVPASTQKIITSAAALAILGGDFRYKTQFASQNDTLYVISSGDPTLGSSRWSTTTPDALLQDIHSKAPNTNFKHVVATNSRWQGYAIPPSWLKEDIGNYYGAGAFKFNWRENQYDLFLRSGAKIGSAVSVVGSQPRLYGYSLKSELRSGPAGSGDNAYIYHPETGNTGSIKGTIPINQKRFRISGSFPDPLKQFAGEILHTVDSAKTGHVEWIDVLPDTLAVFHTVFSPILDSIVYWFNQKSVNLFGEAMLKTIADATMQIGNTDVGVAVLKEFFAGQNIDTSQLLMVDGSGLSPQNRLTTQLEVNILRYAQQQPWFESFFASLPNYNSMKMKSGTLKKVKGFTGYHTATNGKTYIFSFLVNNYSGGHGALVQKMYNVLNHLK